VVPQGIRRYHCTIMQPRHWALIALFVVNLIYGVNYVVAKGLMPDVIGPSGFILLRILGATILFWSMRAISPERVASSDLLRLFWCALFGVALNQLMFFHGLMRTSAVHASIIMVATPILVLVISGWIISERITWMKLSGVILGAIGACLLIIMRNAGEEGASLIGDLCILINASSFALYLVMVKPLMQKYTAVTVMSWTFLFGGVLVLPIGAQELLAVKWSAITTAQAWSITFVVVMVTFVAYLLNTWALRWVNPSVVGMFIYLQPILATALSMAMLQSGLPNAVQWISAACVFFGVHLVNRADRKSVGS
jgi:drug/metabolite transporter (DMT)-like permease